MAQLFTLQFPKYHYEKQRDLQIRFSNASRLPFSYEIIDGMVIVDHIRSPTEAEREDPMTMKQWMKWRKMGLQEGVRMIKVTGKDLTHKSMMEHLTPKFVSDLIIEHTQYDDTVSITFREEVLEFDDSISLGLTYGMADSLGQGQDRSVTNLKVSKEAQLLGDESVKVIRDGQLSASSCQSDHKPSECRLNNPSSCWKPAPMDSELKNSWLSVDLKSKTSVTKLWLQGSPGNESYIKSIWIDHSNDGTHWICHHAAGGEIQCVYDKTVERNDIYGMHPHFQHGKKGHDKFHEILIWPPIQTRFVRIRPVAYHREVALRMDLFTPAMPRQQFARDVRISDLFDEDRAAAMAKIKGVSLEDRVIQVDCRSVIRSALDTANMNYVGFLKTDKDNYLCVFSTSDLTTTEQTIDELMDAGIGRAMGVAGICPMKYRRPMGHSHKDSHSDDDDKKKNVTSGFYASIKSRQIVDQLVDQTRQSAEFTYDYVSMLIVADMIAGMGLLTNSSVVVVASMLVSPIMGPVTALTFGVHLRGYKFAQELARLGLKNEFWSLLICILIGFILGFITNLASKNGLEGATLSEDPWPTAEMTSRGELVGLATGAIVAFASGVGVALSVVGDYMSSVIGVAISASLLPPAVNCGMLWAMSLYVTIWPEYVNEHSASELAFMGLVSIVLTIENIILVFLASLAMFKIKGVTLKKDRNYDENNKQMVYQCITSFQDQWTEIKQRPSSSSLNRSKRAAPSMKNVLFPIVDDAKTEPVSRLTVNPALKNRTLKTSLMRYNTKKQLLARRMSSLSIRRTMSDLDSIMEQDNHGHLDVPRHSNGAQPGYGARPLSLNVHSFESSTSIEAEDETKPLFSPINVTRRSSAMAPVAEDQSDC